MIGTTLSDIETVFPSNNWSVNWTNRPQAPVYIEQLVRFTLSYTEET